MRNKVIYYSIIILSFISIVSFVSSIYAGESKVYSNDLGKDNLVYTIIDNTSELIVLPIITFNVSNITIQIPNDMPPNSFKIVFLEETTNTIIQTIQVSSGGHSHIITKYVNNTVEVPTIQYVLNETIKLVENKTIETEYVNAGEVKIFSVILGLLLVALIIGVLIYFMNRKPNQYNREGGEENGEQRKEKFF